MAYRPIPNLWEDILTPPEPPGSSINFPYNHGTIRQFSVRPWYLLSTFHTSAGHSFKFRQLFVRLSNYPSIFRASAESSVNFRQLSVHPRDLSSTFRASV